MKKKHTCRQDMREEPHRSITIRYVHFCPKCGTELTCPCKHCAKKNRGLSMWIWLPDGEYAKCARCGFTQHADGWLDIEYKQSEHRVRALVQRLWAIAKWHFAQHL